MVVVILTLTVPNQLGVVALYILMGKLGWNGTLLAVIAPGLVSAFGVFYMRQFIEHAVPDELVESARIDGALTMRVYWSIVLPAIRPALAVLGLLTFVATWNEFQWPLITLNGTEFPTSMVALSDLASGNYVIYRRVLAGAFAATVPLLVSAADRRAADRPRHHGRRRQVVMEFRDLVPGTARRLVAQRRRSCPAYPATVPGCVHTDLLAAGLIEDPYLDDNEQKVAWIGRTDWVYRPRSRRSRRTAGSTWSAPGSTRSPPSAQRRRGGPHREHAPRHRFDVRTCSATGQHPEGQFGAHTLRGGAAERLGDRPNAYPEPFNFIRKMACNFGWDWGPTLVTAGIWQDIGLQSLVDRPARRGPSAGDGRGRGGPGRRARHLGAGLRRTGDGGRGRRRPRGGGPDLRARGGADRSPSTTPNSGGHGVRRAAALRPRRDVVRLVRQARRLVPEGRLPFGPAGHRRRRVHRGGQRRPGLRARA